ncbi:hypothetical protein JCM16303_002699 [Sporobolomyces ruberrimus]
MSDVPSRDYISYLPYELLSDIFNRAYKDVQPPRTPISRAFLPFQRRALFHRVKVTSSSQFELLIEAYEGNTRLGGMVKVLEVDNVDEKAIKNVRRLKSFFATLVNLEELELGARCPSLVDVIMSLRIANAELPRLNKLGIGFSAEAKKPFEAKRYRHLDAYPSLHRLELSHEGKETFSSSTRGVQPLAKIDELVLRGAWAFLPQTLSLVNNFPHLTSLVLDTFDFADPEYDELVARLPVSLTSLSLRTYGYYDDVSEPCDQYFPRLINLEYLYLGESTYSLDLITSLRQLPKLKTLGFGRGVGPSLVRLEELSIGPNPLSSLEKLVFDQVEGKMGWRIEKDSEGMTLHPDHSTTTGISDLVGAKGIRVEGTTVEAFGIFEEFDDEVGLCLTEYACESGDFVECRKMMGEEYVADLIEDLIFAVLFLRHL